MPIFSHRSKSILFIHIPKTGGSSIETTLANECSTSLYAPFYRRTFAVTPQHFTMADICYLFPSWEWDLAFAMVRNPYDRFVSEFRYQAESTAERFGMAPDFHSWAEAKLEAAADDPHLDDNHFRPQVEFVTDAVEVFRLEDGLPKAAARVSEALEIRVSFHRRLNAPSNRRPVPLDGDVKAEVARFYRRDFERFGYEDA